MDAGNAPTVSGAAPALADDMDMSMPSGHHHTSGFSFGAPAPEVGSGVALVSLSALTCFGAVWRRRRRR